MIANLQDRKEKAQEQIDLIAKQFGQTGGDNADLAARMEELRKEMEQIDLKLVERYQMLEDANSTIQAAKERLAGLKQEQHNVQERLDENMDKHVSDLQKNLLATYNDMVSSSLEPLMPTLSDWQHELLEEPGYNSLAKAPASILNCALMLALNYVREATAYAESCGGGGSHPSSGWGRDKDDDDEYWWRRCISQSAAMMRSAAPKRKRRR